jgi:hypothetical protein
LTGGVFEELDCPLVVAGIALPSPSLTLRVDFLNAGGGKLARPDPSVTALISLLLSNPVDGFPNPNDPCTTRGSEPLSNLFLISDSFPVAPVVRAFGTAEEFDGVVALLLRRAIRSANEVGGFDL